MGPASKRFDLVGRLGEGASGVVYDAFDRERGARVALKMLRHVSPDSLARLKREFRTVQDVHHANLVRLGELVFDDDEWCFTMELVEGLDFIAYVRAKNPSQPEIFEAPVDARALGLASTEVARPAVGAHFDEARAREAFRQLAGGLTALHAAGLVHRDVKPSNLERAEETFATQCVGAAWELDTMRLFAVNCLAQLGRLADAEARASRHLRESFFRGDLYAAVNLRIGFANLRWLASDEPDLARRAIADAMHEWSKRGVHLEHFYELLALRGAR